MTNNIVAVVDQDGYAFVSTKDGNAGMSVSALSRVCGVPRSSLRDLLEKAVGGKTNVKTLESLWGKDIHLAERGSKNEKYIRAEVCNKIAIYYAYCANKTTDEAKHAVDKFSEEGVKEWIHSITGYKQEKYNVAKEFVQSYARIYKPEFSKEFYNELYRVTGYIRPGRGQNPYTAIIIREKVYAMFGCEVLAELDRINPIIGYVTHEVPRATKAQLAAQRKKIGDKKKAITLNKRFNNLSKVKQAEQKLERLEEKYTRMQRTHSLRLPKRKYCFHQLCSELVGLPSLQLHLQSMVQIMRTLPSDDIDRFDDAMRKAFPEGAIKNVSSLILDVPVLPE